MDENTQEVIHTELHYDVQNMMGVLEKFRTDRHFVLEEWDGSRGKGHFFKGMYHYEDNAAKGPIQLAEDVGGVEIDHGKMVYTSLYPEEVAAFKQWINEVVGATLREEKTTTVQAPAGMQLMTYGVNLPKGVPSEFALIAQYGLLLNELNQPLPLFENHSPEEMVTLGKMDELEQWLRGQEYSSYMNMSHESREVKVTPDFNTIRRKLGLELSPFVTLGKERQSKIMAVMTEPTVLTEEELLLFRGNWDSNA